MKLCSSIPVLGLSFALATQGWGAPDPVEGTEFFEKKIRPVLVAECYECHGAEKQKGGLRLDSREALRAGGESGPAIVAGKPDESLLVRSIKHLDADLKMPKKAPKLEEHVLADFVAWVKMGAPDPRVEPEENVAVGKATWPELLAARRDWWCFQPLKTARPPAPRDTAWSNHPIDRFTLTRMEERGLSPAPDADPHALIRRLSFALTGLPPTPEQVEAFVRDDHTPFRDGESRVGAAADSLLASSAFGERWARHWMDLARYAETFGSEHDYLNPHAWQYRDYLVRAFNTDLPYDRFVHEQIAGDLLPPRWHNGINEALLGTAWHRMIESYASPVDVKREEATVIDWQIEALGKTFLGLTIQCARCHDHKFDPISAADFYALYGVFASTRPTLSILDDPAKLTAHDAELTRLKNGLRTELAERWEADLTPAALEVALKRDGKDALSTLRELAKAPDFSRGWRELRDRLGKRPTVPADQVLFADLTRGDLAGWRVAGPGLPQIPAVAGGLSIGLGNSLVRAIYPAGLFSDAISERHGGALRSPEFIIEKHAVSVLASGAGKARLRLVIENFQNDLLLYKGVNPDLDSNAPHWVTMPIKEQWLGRRARVELLTRDDKTCVGEVKDQEKWATTDGRSAFGIQRVVLHDGPAPSALSPFPAMLWQSEPRSWGEFIEQLSSTADAARSAWAAGYADDDDARLLQALLDGGVLRNQAAGAEKAAEFVAAFRDLEALIPQPTRAPGVCDDGYAYDSPLFPRGDHLHPATAVARRFLEVLGAASLGGGGSGRDALARELTGPNNPLAARVMVNRIWQHLTGVGLVATPDNFGRMGEKPTHPELLDHLADTFVKGGWSVKSLIRYIVTSRTWQLAAEVPRSADELDANNELLSHAHVRRLDAEAIRDSILRVAGNLASGYTGPGMRVFYRTEIDPVRQPAPGPVDGAGHRSIYLEGRRLFSSEFLAAFDVPRPTILTGRRSDTNVPAQSLALLNDPFVQHQAEVWAKAIEQLQMSAEERIDRMYLEAFARRPSNEERSRAIAFLGNSGETLWRDLAHALFNAKEFIYLR